MTDLIKVGFAVETDGIEQGEVALKRLSQAGDNVDKSFKRGSTAAKDTGTAAEAAGKSADKASQSFGKFSTETKNMANSTGALTATVAKLGGVLGSAFALDKTIRTVTAFEDSILRLRATSNASVESMAALEKQSRTLGATSRYSAQQAAEAQNFLAMAGLKVNEILSATPSVMKFASAASMDLARSADIASNVLGGMQMPVSQLDRTMNTMINTAQSANTNVSQLGDAFAYAAPLAVTAAINIETLAAATGVLGDAGIQGGRAGTGLVGVIRQLSNVTPVAQEALASYGISLGDVDIKSRGLTNVLETLNKANISTADAMRIFGSESAAAALILSANVEKVKELAAANEGAAGKLTEVASILDGGLSAAFASVSSAIEELMLSTGDAGLAGSLKVLAITTAGVINNFNGLLPEFAEANGLSKEFQSNINLLTFGLKTAGTFVAIYGAAVLAASIHTRAAAAANAVYALSLQTVAAQATLASKAVLLLKKSALLVMAAFTGWSIGTYLRQEFEVVEKAGIALAGGIHTMFASVKGTFDVLSEQMKFALSSPIDFARGKIADFFVWLNGLGAGTLSFFGIDTTEMEANIAKAGAEIRGVTAAEHKATIDAIKAQNKKEIGAIADGYASLFADVGKSSKTAKVALDNTAVSTKKLGDASNALNSTMLETESASKSVASSLKKQKEQIDKTVLSIVKNTDSIKQGNAAMRLEVDSIGKTNRELVAMEQQRNRGIIAQLREVETSIRSVDGREAETAAIREQIAALEERNQLLGERIDTQEVYESQKKIADQWQSLSDDMGRTFTDAIINGGANAKEAIKRMFTNMVLRPIIEPIAQGVAGMFTQMLGGGQGGGQGGGIAGALTGGGGQGGGFSLGNIASIGKNIYSAFTGWGKAAYQGWQSGGLSGAWGGATAGFSGGFGSFTAGVKGATLAPGLAGPTTAGASGLMGLGNTLGTIGNMAGPLAAIAGVLKGYQNSGLKGAVAGGAGGFLGAKGGAALGSAILPGVGTAIGAIIGGALGAIGGSKLFGGKWQTKAAGIALAVNQGELSGWDYEYKKKKGGLFSSNKKKTSYSAMDEDTLSEFKGTYDNIVDSVIGVYKVFGFELEKSILKATDVTEKDIAKMSATFGSAFTDAALKLFPEGGSIMRSLVEMVGGESGGFKSNLKLVNLMGLSEEQAKEAIGEYFAGLTEEISAFLGNKLDLDIDYDFEELAELAQSLTAANSVFELINQTALAASITSAEFAQEMVNMTGGLEGFIQASESYYQNFFTEEEKARDTMDAMTKAMKDAGLEAVESRQGYRDMVEGLDLTTDAGREMFTTMISLAGVASEYFSVLEAQAAYIQSINDQLQGMSDGLDTKLLTGYQTALIGIKGEFEILTEVLKGADLATDENAATLAAWANQMREMAALDLFQNGQDIANTLRDGLLGNWDGGNIGNYIAQSISDGVYGAIAGEFSSQITNILLQGIVAPMINAAMTGASISEAVSKQSIAAVVEQAQAVAGAAAEVMKALADSGVLEELQKAMGGLKIDPVKSKQLYSAPAVMKPIDDSWKRILESIINRTKAAEKTLADMGRSTYEKGLADIAALVADYQSQIAAGTASRRGQMLAELQKLEAQERKLLEAQMDQRATDTLSGINKELERMGKTDAQIAMMDINDRAAEYIKSLEDIGRATTDNIAQVDAWADAMREAAAKDAQIKSAGNAYDALGRAVDAQRSVITEALELARDVADAAGNASKDLFASVLSSSTQGAEQARKFIADSLSNAQTTGYLPDSDALRNAIDAATRGFDDAAAQSVAQSSFDKLVLANQLQQLADIAEPQANYAQEQLNSLDAMLENAKGQLDVLQGIDTTVLTVAEALERFNQVMGANDPVVLPDSPVFTPAMPPQTQTPDNSATTANTAMLAEVIELRETMREIQRETKRTADAVNGRGDAPILVEVV